MTKLFALPIEGVGTGDVESLSSYMIRLAYVHGKSVDQFLRFLSFWAQARFPSTSKKTTFYKNVPIVALSKPTALAENLVKILDGASSVTGIRSSTLLSLAPPFQKNAGYTNNKLNWCPRCMAEWRMSGATAYFKLVWLFKDAKYCQHHSIPLIDKCPRCAKPQSGFDFKVSLSECGHCGASLAAPVRQADVLSIRERTAGDIFHLVEQIALDFELNFVSHGAKEILTQLDQQADLDEDARAIFNSLFPTYWRQLGPRAHRMTFAATRAFAAITGMTLHDVLQGNCVGQMRTFSFAWSMGTKNQWKLETRKRQNCEQKKAELLVFLQATEGTFPSLAKVARALNVSDGFLRYRFRTQALKIANDYRLHEKREAERKRLEARSAAIAYFSNPDIDDRVKSRKSAMRALRATTTLSKGLLRTQIAEIFALRHSKLVKPKTSSLMRRGVGGVSATV